MRYKNLKVVERASFMKKYDTLVFVGIITTLLILLVMNVPNGFASEITNYFLGSTVNDENQTNELNINQTVENEPAISEFFVDPDENITRELERYKTSTGLELTIGRVKNEGQERNVTVYITNRDEWISFDVFLPENSTWEYGLINKILILPEKVRVKILTNETNYYRFNKQLIIGINGSDSKLYIFSKEKPNRVVADVSTVWRYDKEKNFVTIQLSSHSTHKITIDWTHYPISSGTIYVEDRKKIEEMKYGLNILNAKLINYTSLYNSLTERLEELINITNKLESILNNKTMEKETLEEEQSEIIEKIREVNRTKTKLEEKLKDKTIISPVKAALLSIAFIIIVGYILLVQFGRISQRQSSKGVVETKIITGENNENK